MTERFAKQRRTGREPTLDLGFREHEQIDRTGQRRQCGEHVRDAIAAMSMWTRPHDDDVIGIGTWGGRAVDERPEQHDARDGGHSRTRTRRRTSDLTDPIIAIEVSGAGSSR